MECVSKGKEKGITLIALVITIIVLLILAGVTINLTIGERGIFTTAQNSAKNYTNSQDKELAELDVFDEEINVAISVLGTGWNETKKVNAPKLADGLTPVTISDDGTITKVSQYDNNWYDYENQKWANAQSADGSLWVWIPRYAYKIKQPTESQSVTIEVVFLKGTSDESEEKGITMKRATEVSGNWDTEGKIGGEDVYIVHPAFCDGSSDGYPNGEWDAEITGFWIAKFEAGFAGEASGNNVASSPICYTVLPSEGIHVGNDQNYYGNMTKESFIKYPIFKANRPSFNNISIGDSYELCKGLTGPNNPYGFNANEINSHLIKNGEWGAVAYLSWSKYGTNKMKISINNVVATRRKYC